jgi:hypothetical protein
MKPTTGSHTRPAATSRAAPIHALGVAGGGPRPSDPQRPICARDGCTESLAGKRADARFCSRACNQAFRRARQATRKVHGRSGPSGLQLPYARMVRALIADFRDLNLPNAEARAREMVRRELSDRQRARLDERRTT